jgi:hypothetical protein
VSEHGQTNLKAKPTDIALVLMDQNAENRWPDAPAQSTRAAEVQVGLALVSTTEPSRETNAKPIAAAAPDWPPKPFDRTAPFDVLRHGAWVIA